MQHSVLVQSGRLTISDNHNLPEEITRTHKGFRLLLQFHRIRDFVGRLDIQFSDGTQKRHNLFGTVLQPVAHYLE